MSVTTRVTDDDTAGLAGGPPLPLGLTLADVNCPICVETISDPFVTSCGHTFCYQCITTQLTHKNSCPSCGAYLTADHIYPNFLLNKVRGCMEAAAGTLGYDSCTGATTLRWSCRPLATYKGVGWACAGPPHAPVFAGGGHMAARTCAEFAPPPPARLRLPCSQRQSPPPCKHHSLRPSCAPPHSKRMSNCPRTTAHRSCARLPPPPHPPAPPCWTRSSAC